MKNCSDLNGKDLKIFISLYFSGLDYIYLSNGIDFFIIGSVTVIANQKFAYFVSFFLLPLSLLKMLKSFAKSLIPR